MQYYWCWIETWNMSLISSHLLTKAMLGLVVESKLWLPDD
jgi:hypothetical protein